MLKRLIIVFFFSKMPSLGLSVPIKTAAFMPFKLILAISTILQSVLIPYKLTTADADVLICKSRLNQRAQCAAIRVHHRQTAAHCGSSRGREEIKRRIQVFSSGRGAKQKKVQGVPH